MDRYRDYWPLDDAPLVDGDTVWRGVREDLPAQLIPPGFAARGKNVRFTNGEAAPRGGIQILRWGLGDGSTPFPTPRGAGVFKDPNGEEWILVAAGTGVYATRPNNVAVALICEATLAEDCRFTQAFDQVLLGRGFDAAALEMKSFNTGFTLITEETSQSGNGTGTFPAPAFFYGEFIQNRVVFAAADDVAYYSDVLNYTRTSIEQSGRINQGGNDRLVRCFKFNDQTLIAFKGLSIYQVTNLVPDTNGNWSGAVLDDVTKNHGLAAGRAVCKVGNDLYYLSTKGLTSIGVTEQNKLRSLDIPLSEQLKRTFGRINWRYIQNATLEEYDNKLYLAVPLDEAKLWGNNVVNPTATSDGSGNYTLTGLTAGQTYRFVPDGSFTSYDNNGVDGFGLTEFVAGATSITIFGNASTAVTAEVQLLTATGVNTGVLVYDLKNQAWAGSDEADQVICVKDWIKFTYHEVPRLGFLGVDGYLHLYEEGKTDERVAVPEPYYVDVLVNSMPTPAGSTSDPASSPGSTIEANLGGVVYAVNWPDNSTGWWGIDGTLEEVAANLAAYYVATPALCPQATPSAIAGGVRFTSTSGAAATVKTDGTVRTASGLYGWAYVDLHDAPAVRAFDIVTELVTRGYSCGNPSDAADQRSKGRKLFDLVKLQVGTRSPTFSVSVATDGMNETKTLIADKTRSRTRYTVHGRAAWNPSNVNDDWATAKREDYTVTMDPEFNLAEVNLDQQQVWDPAARVGVLGRHAQFTVTNETGWLVLGAVELQARVVDRGIGVKT